MTETMLRRGGARGRARRGGLPWCPSLPPLWLMAASRVESLRRLRVLGSN